MIRVERAHRLFAIEIRKFLIQLFEAGEISIEIGCILNQRLEIENGNELLPRAKPEQVDSHQRMVKAVIGIGNRIQNLQLVTSIKPGDPPATEIRDLPKPAADHAGAFLGLAFFEPSGHVYGLTASLLDAVVKFLEKWIKHVSALLGWRIVVSSLSGG